MTTFLTVDGVRARTASIDLNSGMWFADIDFDAVVPLAAKPTAVLGGLTLLGSIVPEFLGTFQQATKCRILGGAGWLKAIPRKHFHNDAGVKASTVLKDAAATCGETLILDAPDQILAADWARRNGTGMRTIETLYPKWYVDTRGTTHTAPRPATEITVDYEVLDFDPRMKVLTLAYDDLSGILPGSIVRKRLDKPITIKDMRITVDSGMLRVSAWGRE